MESYELLVDPQYLYNEAGNMSQVLGRIRDRMESMEEKVRATESIWLGEAGDLYRSRYFEQKEVFESILKRLEEHPRDLMEMSGFYTQAETVNTQEADALPSDAIV